MSAWASSPTEPKRATVRRRNAALFTFGLLGTGVGVPAFAQGTAAHAGDTGVVVTRDVMVPMRDGIRLATDVYRPRADGGAATEKLPTILIRTPYDKAFDPTNRRAFGSLSSERRVFLRQLPLRRGTTPLQLAPEYEEWLVQAMAHGANDDFWAQNDIIDHADRYKDIPVYLIGGWYDSWAGSTAANFVALSRRLKSPVYLIMGPWIHGSQDRSAHGQVSFGPDAAMSQLLPWWQEWFDHFLKGKDNSVGKAAPFSSRVRIFVMGTGDHTKDAQGRMAHGGRWRDEREWPLARTRYTSYYLQPGGGLALQPPAAERSETSFVFDPHDPVPTIGGNISSGDGILLQGGWDQRGGDAVWNWPRPVPLSARADVVVFQTPPLETDVEVTGPITVKLWASSNRRDTDFTAKLIDVHPPSPDYPQGFDLNLEDGIIRARFRDSLARERLMQRGTVYEFTIQLYPTANVFRKGHRVRVGSLNSNFRPL